MSFKYAIIVPDQFQRLSGQVHLHTMAEVASRWIRRRDGRLSHGHDKPLVFFSETKLKYVCFKKSKNCRQQPIDIVN